MPRKKAADTPAKDDARDAAFRRLAGKRVPKALKAISLVASLGRYKPTEKQADLIVGALTTAVDNCSEQLRTAKVALPEFSLED